MHTKSKVMLVVVALLGAACESSETDQAAIPEPSAAALYVTSTVVSTDEAANTYISVLDALGSQDIDTGQALESSGWSDVAGSAGELFVADGESLTMQRFEVSGPGRFAETGKIDFTDHGAVNANSTFVENDKAYAFGDEIVKWNPRTLEIFGSFASAEAKDRENGMEFSGIFAGRAVATRDQRAYYAAHWANWDDYEVSEDSLIIVVDTDKDEIINTIEVPCPYLDFATIDEDDTIYFSNWTYSVPGTLLHGKRKACAVRLLAGQDRIDEDWSLTFADVTDGREAAALGYVGDRKALISVFYDEDAEIKEETTTERSPTARTGTPGCSMWTRSRPARSTKSALTAEVTRQRPSTAEASP